MPQYTNEQVVGHFLRSIIDVMSRRTSEGYALVIIGNVIKQMNQKYSSLKYVQIKNSQYSEGTDAVFISQDINTYESKEIGNIIKDLIENLIQLMGKDAGYFFMKEIKEYFPYDFNQTMKNQGIDLEYMQHSYIVEKKQTIKKTETTNDKTTMKNSKIINYIINILFKVVEKEKGKSFAYNTINKVITNAKKENDILRYVRINDIQSLQGIDLVTVNDEINSFDQRQLGNIMQNIMVNVSIELPDLNGVQFMDKLESLISSDYNKKFEEMGLNIETIFLQQGTVLRYVLNTVIVILFETMDYNTTIDLINKIIKDLEPKYNYLKGLEVDSLKYRQGLTGIIIPDTISTISSTELGRILQKILEKIVTNPNVKIDSDFIKNFKKQIDESYLRKIEEMGVNLHIVEMKSSLL